MKVYPIPHAIYETTSSWKITPLYFLAQTLYTLDKKSSLKRKFQTFEWLGENSPTSSCHI